MARAMDDVASGDVGNVARAGRVTDEGEVGTQRGAIACGARRDATPVVNAQSLELTQEATHDTDARRL